MEHYLFHVSRQRQTRTEFRSPDYALKSIVEKYDKTQREFFSRMKRK